jgi:hypothetical protein
MNIKTLLQIFCLFLFVNIGALSAYGQQPQETKETKTPNTAKESPEKTAGDITKLLTGSWKLVSVEETVGEATTYPLGKSVVGYLNYDASGHMAQQLMSATRPRVPIREANPVQLDEIIAGFDAYSGTYTVNAATGTITYHVECSIHPNIIDKELARQFKLNGDELIIQSSFSNKSDNLPRVRTIKWQRMK